MDKLGVTPKTVFDRAHEIPPGPERDAYVNLVCAEVPAVRHKVEGLLRAYDEAGSFLEQAAVETPLTGSYQPKQDYSENSSEMEPATVVSVTSARDDTAEGIGAQIGPYRLLKKLGAGGMGAVYLAEQEQPVRRKVALKVIKPGLDKEQVIARFEAERQALALMNHPNIAKVFDGGATTDGWPYFVMELVDGLPMNQYCDEKSLTVRERLELFVPVCQALQHAHQKGIIHRDIKPSNVLVMQADDKAVAKVIDFGIAKAVEQRLTERTLVTQAGAVIGTLRYMSPEQADPIARDVDTRSDVYSLGVLLYELLTGTTPIDGRRLHDLGLIDALLMIHGEDVPRPSARIAGLAERLTKVAEQRQIEPARLAKLLRGELDWIVMKALEKDRHRRYQSAADFASDIECYLKDEPVQACPPSTRYRLGKFARKHRVMLASAAGLLVLLLAGIVGLTLANRKVTAALDAEIEAQTETYAGLDTADGVIQALIRSRVKVRDSEKSILRNALKLNAKFFDDPGMTPKARARTADMHLRVANIHVFLDEPQKAEIAYGKAVELYQKLASDFPAAEVYRDQLAKSNFNLGFLLNDQNNRAEAEAAFRRCVALHENLAADSPTMPRYQGDLADDLNNLGVVLSEQSKFADAAGVYGQAIRLGEKLTAAYPDFANYQINLAGSYSNLGNVVRDQGNPAEALNWYGKAITSLTAVRAANRQFEDARLYLRNAHWDRANALGRLARHGEAINDWQRAIGLDEGRDRDSLLLFLEAAKTEEQLKKQVKASNAAAASGLLYDAARVLAQAAGAAGISNEPALQKHYASRALALLREAKAAGLFHDGKRIEELKKDQALLALRQDSGYQKFVAELVAGMKQ